jgi:type IV/VI secretion system ImpK/VasF family protein
MTTRDPLWFHIEEAFTEVLELCLEARAAQLVVAQREAETQAVRSIGAGGSTPAPADKAQETGRYAGAAALAKDASFREAHPHGPDLVVVRQRLRRRLGEVRARLAETLSEHEVYHVLFPFVVYSDELLATATRGAVNRWEPMQSELYEIDNGGELFYTVLEERLKQDETHPLVFETYYFCLNDGFTGMLQPGSRKIDDHKAQLRQRIPRAELRFPEVSREQKRPELVDFPWKYYAVAAAVVVFVYAVLSWTAGG